MHEGERGRKREREAKKQVVPILLSSLPSIHQQSHSRSLSSSPRLSLAPTHTHAGTHKHVLCVTTVGQAARLPSKGCRTQRPSTTNTPKLIPLYIPNWKEEGLSSNCFLMPLSPPRLLLLFPLLSPPSLPHQPPFLSARPSPCMHSTWQQTSRGGR